MEQFASKYNIIEKYGIVLKRLTEEKIELVRRWRNDPKIRQYMEYRDEITSEMQRQWYESINNDSNLYYLICIADSEVGLINIRDIYHGKGEGGVFIWDDRYLNSDISYRAHLALFDYYFSVPGHETVVSHVLNDNKRAQRFTGFLGFIKDEGQENVYNQRYSLSREDYFSNLNRKRYTERYKLNQL